jgi:hypothetical protein
MERDQRFLATAFLPFTGAAGFFAIAFAGTTFLAGATAFWTAAFFAAAPEPLLLGAEGAFGGSGFVASMRGGRGVCSGAGTSPKAFITMPRISSTGTGLPLQISN